MMLSFSKPLRKLYKERPPTSIFHWSLVISVSVQFVTHLSVLIYFVNFFGLKEEKARLLEAFTSIDTDHDGQLTRKEVMAAYQKVSKNSDVESDVNELFKKLDFNNTDAIDFSEFLVANINYKNSINDKQLHQIFQIIDKDKNGFLETEELKDFFNLGGKENEALLKALIAEVDKNNDGKIAKPELFEIFKKVANQ